MPVGRSIWGKILGLEYDPRSAASDRAHFSLGGQICMHYRDLEDPRGAYNYVGLCHQIFLIVV